MKKTVVAGLVCLLTFSSVLPVSAHRHHNYDDYDYDYCSGQNCAEYGCFIDEDEDGICDNSQCLDADGNSVCGANHHDCQYFVDENEDGSCDHCAEIAYSKSYSRQRGCGRGRHHGRGHH